MKGKYAVRVQNSFVRFDFEIERNISIIRGNSGTGKTTLVGMISDYQNEGAASGVLLDCKVKCVAMIGQNNTWKDFLKNNRSCIVFIDEGEKYIRSKEFAEAIQATDNYYVIATRDNLFEIPYSVDAIYEFKTSGKYGRTKLVYNRFKQIYAAKLPKNAKLKSNDMVITEDSQSGFQFFKYVCDKYKVDCISSFGKSRILTELKSRSKDNILVIADGAAFGPEMANVYEMTHNGKVVLFLPESFEWLILKAGITDSKEVDEILDRPCDFIDSELYFSWERFFTDLLIKHSQGKVYSYNKRSIAVYYLSDRSAKRILEPFFDDI